MSIVKDRESQQVVVRERRQVQHRLHQSIPSVKSVPTITVRTRFIEKPAAKPSLAVVVGRHVAGFLAIAGVTCFLSSLAGQVMVEKARRDVVESSQRTSEARKTEALVQGRVDLLTRADKVEEWAMAHGMVPSDGLGQTAALATHGADIH